MFAWATLGEGSAQGLRKVDDAAAFVTQPRRMGDVAAYDRGQVSESKLGYTP
jgi:hypothetical protein